MPGISPSEAQTGFKVPCRQRDSFYVVGWAEREGKRFDGLYLARQQGDELVYAGKLERGFSEEDKRDREAAHAPPRSQAADGRRQGELPEGSMGKARRAGGRGVSRQDRRGPAAASCIQGHPSSTFDPVKDARVQGSDQKAS